MNKLGGYPPKSISGGAQYVTPSLVVLLFGNPTQKTETGRANRCGTTTTVIANHLDESL